MIYIAVHLVQIFSAGPASQPRGSEVVQEVLADLKRVAIIVNTFEWIKVYPKLLSGQVGEMACTLKKFCGKGCLSFNPQSGKILLHVWLWEFRKYISNSKLLQARQKSSFWDRACRDLGMSCLLPHCWGRLQVFLRGALDNTGKKAMWGGGVCVCVNCVSYIDTTVNVVTLWPQTSNSPKIQESVLLNPVDCLLSLSPPPLLVPMFSPIPNLEHFELFDLKVAWGRWLPGQNCDRQCLRVEE